MRLDVILNSSAGTLLGVPLERAAETIETAFQAAGHFARCRVVSAKGLKLAVREAARGPADVVVVGGGDGTIATAAHLLAGTGKALGVLPLGTMNLLARDLGLPLALEEAVHALAQGEICQIDVAEVNGVPFLNNSAIGFYPRMVEERERQRGAPLLRKWSALALAAFRTLARNRLIEVDLDLEGGERRRIETPMIAVANNAYDGADGPVVSRSCLTGGVLAVYVARHLTRWQLLGLGARFLTGGWRTDPQIEVFLVRACVVRTRHRWLRVANDGEVLRLTSPLHFRIRPGDLPVLRPRPSLEAMAS